MHLYQADELRRIRITLVVMTIILLFSGGRSANVTVDHIDEQMTGIPTYHKNLVPLGNGYFGLYSGDRQSEQDNKMKVYYYNDKENKMVLKQDVNLGTVEENLE
ncbi:hypothetical protein [Bacillus sp. NEB1478]|uniref:hypothetical protein n=1 Tax=Bacillus sp. NEB1478 TaxID=3073816 RepID=UPI002873C09E|nr:hypothetical protein [Bacillus sp. NEB1478]WNB91204.1 hypothetical protein RGB74_15010 [Bacillus sp. NEB1478]